jgi:ABC-type glycerol-3-phosphate transport system substrate-binding protein
MKYIVIVPAVLLAALILAAGCTGGGGQATPAATTAPTPVPTMQLSTSALPTTSAGASIQPGPTDTMPEEDAVTVTVEKGGTYSTTIITSFDGGKGSKIVSKIDVRVTRPDGSVVTGVLKPLIGENIELEGTNGTDRVEVIVTLMSGKVYKIIDQQMPYKTRG